jgi:type II secretory pathway pseudopilin PulG
MRRPGDRPSPRGGRLQPCGFTLVETMVGMTVGVLVLAAIASILVMAARFAYRNKEIDGAVANTRLVQEHINGELSIAISQTKPVVIRPEFSDASSTTPKRYAQMSYRVPVGSFPSVSTAIQADDLSATSSIDLSCSADTTPWAGDYLMMDAPNLGTGVVIETVDDPAPGTERIVKLTLAATLGNSTTDTSPADIEVGTLATIQRKRRYLTVAPADGSAVTELRWYSTVSNDHYLVLSRNVAAATRYLFAQIPEDTSATEPAAEPSVSWSFSYLSGESVVGLPGGKPDFYQTAYAEGLIMPKSGDPLNAASIAGGGSTTSTTTSTSSTTTSTSSTTSSSSTTTSTTTTKTTTSKTTSTSTTSKSTTSTTSTSKTTTSKTTSTSTSSKSTTSTSKTTTSKTTTTSTSSKSTTSTTSSKTTTTSTTSKSTTSTTSTTSKSTTSTIPFDG